MSLKPSEEQSNIIDNLSNYDVLVDAVAGSGKTTTSCFVAKTYSDLGIILITYSSKLKSETREKIRDWGITNMIAHSYHSFCHNFYCPAPTDKGIKAAVVSDDMIYSGSQCDILILDEVQDMTPLFFKFYLKVRHDTGAKRVCILGDKNQSIFEFNGADRRYISLGDMIFEGNWIKCSLSVSYRITEHNATFINHALGHKRIVAASAAPTASAAGEPIKPRYIVCDIYKYPYELLQEYLKIYEPGEIFILAPSIRRAGKHHNPLTNLVRKIKDIMYYIPSSDYEAVNSKVSEGKLIISSFHQSKGLERPLVIILGFDSSYYKYYAKTDDTGYCNNTMYVALTRAKKELVVLHSNKHNFFSFIDQDVLDNMCRYEEGELRRQEDSGRPANKTVTQLTRFVPPALNDECLALCSAVVIRQPRTMIKMAHEVWQPANEYYGYGEHFESVSDINGILIPAIYEYKLTGKMTIYDRLCKYWNLFTGEDDEPREYRRELTAAATSVSGAERDNIVNWTHIAIDYSSKGTYNHKQRQICKCDWLRPQEINLCMGRLDLLKLSADARFEISVDRNNICGEIDCIDSPCFGKTESETEGGTKGETDDLSNGIMYEFKCVNELQDAHILQVLLYMYCTQRENDAYLFNILTGEIIEISCSLDNLDKIATLLRNYVPPVISDEQFVSDHKLMV